MLQRLLTLSQILVVLVILSFLFIQSRAVRFLFRSLLYIVLLLVSALVAILSMIVLIPLGKGKYCNRICALCLKTLGPLCGLRHRVVGTQRALEQLNHARPCVIVTNHQSNLDMACILPRNCFILAKQELLKVPIVGTFLRYSGNILINRSDRTSAIETMRQVAKRCKEQQCALWMYPEGTRSYQQDKTLLPFKKGAFHIAAEEGIPIIPVVMSTYAPFYDEQEWRFEPCCIEIRVLESIVGRDVDQLLHDTRSKMEDCLKIMETTGNASDLVSKEQGQEWLEQRAQRD